MSTIFYGLIRFSIVISIRHAVGSFMRILRDIESPRLLIVKGGLMLFCGVFASALLIILHPNWITVALIAATIFGFCRFYYFAFYVIEHYIDPKFKFAGLTSALRFILSKR